jgi:hypothetical protein
MAVGSNSAPALRGVDLTKVTAPSSSDSDGRRLKVIGGRSEEPPVDEAALEVEIFDLGTALRRSLFRETIDRETIARIEACLYHHPTPTFRWLRDIFDDAGEELRPHLSRVHGVLMSSEGKSPYEASRDREMCYRLLSIMQVVCPEMISLAASAA